MEQSDDKLVIEYVCIGNNGRSPAACALAEAYIQRNGVDNIIEVCSSGTNANPDIQFGIELIVEVLTRVQGSDCLNQSYKQELTRFLQLSSLQEKYERDSEFRDNCERFMREVVGVLAKKERQIRDTVLRENNLSYSKEPEQTVAKPDVKLILPITRSLVRRVQRIYATSPEIETPDIYSLQDYAEIPEGVFEDTLGKGIEQYRSFFQTMKRAVQKSIDRAVKDYNPRGKE